MSKIHDRYNKLKNTYLDEINALEDLALLEATDDELQEKATKLRRKAFELLSKRCEEFNGLETDLLRESEDLMLELLPEAFALAREVTKRLLGMRHYDVQIIAGVALHLGKITELKNGEGKTIVTLLPAYLNSLFVNAEYSLRSAQNPNFRKRNVHVMTTNPYLARRDYVWLTPVYDFLGVTVGYLQDTHDPGGYAMDTLERNTMYSADVVYGPAKEFVFDYLRDNHTDSKSHQVQPSYYFIIVDEVDHVLLDEAETPHILSGKSPTIPNEDLGLIYWTTHLSHRFNAGKALLALSADQNKFALTRTGQDVSRIVAKRIINSDQYPAYSNLFSQRELALGVIVQFLEIVSFQHAEIVPSSVYGEIAKLSRWTKSNVGEFYKTSSQGELLELSDTSRTLIRSIVDKNYEKESFVELFGLLTKLIPYMFRNFTTIGLEIAQLGLTMTEMRDVQVSALKILPRLSIGGQAQNQLVTDWISEFVVFFLGSIEKVLTLNPQFFMRIIQDISLFFNAYTSSFKMEIFPNTILSTIENLQDSSWGQKLDIKTTRSMAPDAFARVVDIAIVPALVDLMNPGIKRKPTNILLLAYPMIFRLIRKIGQLESPRNRAERELFEQGEELARTFNVNVYEIVDPHQEIRLTRWGEMIVDDYAEQIVNNKLWMGDSLRDDELEKAEELSRRLRFLVNRGLVAYATYNRDNHYVIQRNRFQEYENFTNRNINHEVVIISDLTGRMQAGRRWNQWLHSFIEAKEGLPVKPEMKSIGRITMQGYIGMYPKTAGMTGTAHVGTMPLFLATVKRTVRTVQKIKSILKREPIDMFEEKILTTDPIEDEFVNVYETEVVVIPPHREIQREDLPDAVFINQKARLNAVILHVLNIHETNQPILVETTSISQSKEVATAIEAYARKLGMKVNVQLLNALTYEQEAEIISKAGLPGAIAVATQMAGRGTDIVIPQESLTLGGLYVVGVERQLQRRWDDQISGRAGRQGEVGTSKFFVSLDDSLMKLMNGERAAQMMTNVMASVPEDVPLELKTLDNIVKNNQIQLAHNARSRREKTHGFDQMIAPYRATIYKIRQQTLEVQYICPICNKSKIDVNNENLCCKNCSESPDKPPENTLIWRNFIGQLVSALMDKVIKDAKVEQHLVDKYTSDVTVPNEWDWENLINELNTIWLNNTATKEVLIKEIDFNNQLYPQAERKKLTDAIRRELISGTRNKLFTEIQNQILRKFHKRDKNVLDWDLEALNKELREDFHIVISPSKYKDILNPQERQRMLELDIQSAIEQRVSFFDWTCTDAAIKDQIQTTFNTFLHQDDTLKQNDSDLGEKDLKKQIFEHMHRSYMRLVRQYGKNQLFIYENKVVRDAIDEEWQNMLVESELIIEELRGRSTQEILIQYGARIGGLFQRFYSDIAIQSLSMIFVENAGLNVTDLNVNKPSAHVAGNMSCPCGSNKIFAQCCGEFLHQRMPKIISM
jgi:preprotein translocase subunit SecA